MALAWMYLNAAGVRARIRHATAGDATTGSEGRATGPRRLVGLVAPRSAMPIWWSPRGPPPCKAMRLHSGNFSPNIGNPLCDSALVASSCSTSQCSTRTPPNWGALIWTNAPFTISDARSDVLGPQAAFRPIDEVVLYG